MFPLFYGLWKYVFTKDEFRVLFLGVDKAGKTVDPGLIDKLVDQHLINRPGLAGCRNFKWQINKC